MTDNHPEREIDLMTYPARAASAAAPQDLQRRQLLVGAGLLTGFAAMGAFTSAEAQSNLSAADRAV
ncbi:hypothetical protein LTR94_028850, partial [Friedmanniomyces endolithicus]